MANPEKQQKPTEKTEVAKTEIAPVPTAAPTQAHSELEQLRAENERLKKDRREFEAAARAAVEKIDQAAPVDPKATPAGFFRNSKGQLVDEKYRGLKQYEAGEFLFVDGAFKRPGDRFSVVDTQPGRAWVPLVPKTEPELVRAPSSSPNTQAL